MFIYIKTDVFSIEHKYIINRVATECGYYFEIVFKRRPSPALLHRAISRCGDKTLPVIYGGIMRKRDSARLLDCSPFDNILLINAFSFVCAHSERALIIDRDGRLCDKLMLPLCKIKTLYVLSDRHDLYQQENGRLLRLIGTSAVLLERKIDICDFPAVLAPEGIENGSHQFLFGRGGFLPAGNRVTIRHKSFDRDLQAALYCQTKNKHASLACPEKLCRDGREISLSALKLRLDSSICRGI